MGRLQSQEEQSKPIRVDVVAGCILQQNGKYLLVQERQQKVYGLWNLPAGHVDEGETIEQAAVREVMEETGYKVNLLEKIGIYHESAERAVKHIFSAEITGGELTVDKDELLDAKWLSYTDVERLNHSKKLREPFIWEVIQYLRSSS